MVIIESLMTASMAIIIGLSLAIPFVNYFHAYPIPIPGKYGEGVMRMGVEPIIRFSNDPGTFAAHAFLIMGIAIAASLIPAWTISRLKVSKAMRTG